MSCVVVQRNPGLVNSAFHPSRICKSSIGLPCLGRRGAFTCVGWRVTLCDVITYGSLYNSSEMGCHEEIKYTLFTHRREALLFRKNDVISSCRFWSDVDKIVDRRGREAR